DSRPLPVVGIGKGQITDLTGDGAPKAPTSIRLDFHVANRRGEQGKVGSELDPARAGAEAQSGWINDRDQTSAGRSVRGVTGQNDLIPSLQTHRGGRIVIENKAIR